ncbi:MAG: SDR family oxidoreductase [Actinomycetota bacterium]|nr:SDR family oxidoreductase [Actinomycetota bacterium]MDI7252764.1 SDR family oxidoreductase [Actinomycetota bacterium]
MGVAGRIRVEGFDGRLVFITGGSSGIGLAAARLLAREGADVVIFARGRERLESAVAEMEKERRREGQRLAWRQLDVTDHDQVIRVMEEAVREYGAPDILINCAGRAYPNYFENITYQQFDETMKVHAYGAWNTVSALFPHMKERGGYIVNTSSVLGFMGIFGYTDYAASKFAVVGFSEALRSEARRYGIGVSVLCPPDTDTPGFAVENLTKPPETRAISEGGGLMQPEEVAEALIRGMRKGEFIIGPGSAKMIYRLKRFFPWLVDLVTERGIRKARKNTEMFSKLGC